MCIAIREDRPKRVKITRCKRGGGKGSVPPGLTQRLGKRWVVRSGLEKKLDWDGSTSPRQYPWPIKRQWYASKQAKERSVKFSGGTETEFEGPKGLEPFNNPSRSSLKPVHVDSVSSAMINLSINQGKEKKGPRRTATRPCGEKVKSSKVSRLVILDGLERWSEMMKPERKKELLTACRSTRQFG